MVTRDIYIPSCHWEVHIYYAVTGYNERAIVADLCGISIVIHINPPQRTVVVPIQEAASGWAAFL